MSDKLWEGLTNISFQPRSGYATQPRVAALWRLPWDRVLQRGATPTGLRLLRKSNNGEAATLNQISIELGD